MSMIFSMAFDEGDCVFDFKRCLFEFKGKEFMLYSGNERNHMSIDTVVADDDDKDKAFELIHEFLYLFGWRNQHYFHFLNASGISGDRENLLNRQSSVFQYPRRFFSQADFLAMSDPDSSEDFKNAIALYNDAMYTNDIYYSFYCLYKIIDLPVGGKTRIPSEWINSNIILVIPDDGSRLAKFIYSKTNIGVFLSDECRNAISHVHRDSPTKTSVMPFRSSDFEKINYANSVMLGLARHFIKNEISIPKDVGINIISTDK